MAALRSNYVGNVSSFLGPNTSQGDSGKEFHYPDGNISLAEMLAIAVCSLSFLLPCALARGSE